MHDIVAGGEQREAAISALPEKHASHTANERSNALSDLQCDLEDAFLAIPLRSLADLAFRLDTVRAFSIEDCSYGADLMAEDVQAVIAAAGR